MSPFAKSFFIAQTFLTRIPTPQISSMSEEEISRSILYYPIIGLCIGLFLTLIASTTSDLVNISIHSMVAAILIAVWVLITGALHLDGLADTADGFVGGQGSTERTLSIMKDPASGPIGISAIFLILLLKYSAIVTILNTELSYWSLLLAPVIGRAVAIGLLTYSPVAQQQGLAFELKKTEYPEIVALILFSITIVVYIVTNLMVLIVISLLAYTIRHWAIMRLKGITGDILGLSIELTEAIFLMMAVFMLD